MGHNPMHPAYEMLHGTPVDFSPLGYGLRVTTFLIALGALATFVDWILAARMDT